MLLKIICSHNINLFHFTNFPASICRNGAVPFLEAQELHSRSTFKANVCTFLYISVRNFLFQRSSKILSGEGMRGIRWRWWLNNFLKADHCLGLVKRYTVYHLKWNFGNSTIFYSCFVNFQSITSPAPPPLFSLALKNNLKLNFSLQTKFFFRALMFYDIGPLFKQNTQWHTKTLKW